MTSLRILVASVSAILAAGHALAAPAPTPPAAADEVIALSPFTVSDADDKSWQATTTLIGSRTNQELIKVPVNVDVITSEFMHDLALFSMEDAAAFVAGVDVSPRLETRNDDRINYRGLSTGGMSRNFFTWYVPSDSYNVERYDFAKGSNSLMFGDSSPGGQATIYTKRARSRNATEFFASVGSYEAFRFQLDVNRKLNDKLFVRVNLVNRRNKTYVKNTNDVFRAGHIAFTYEPFKTTTIRVEAERGATHRVRADSALAINDVAAAGRGFSSNNQWYYTSDGEILNRTANNPPLAIDRSGPSGNQVSLLQGQTQAVRLPNGTYKNFTGFDQYTNVLGSVDYNNRIFNVANATVEQRIGKLYLEFAYNQQFQHEDRNDNSFGTSQTPPVLSVDSTGRPYIEESIGGAAFKIFGNVVKAGRVAAVYPFDFGRFGKQLLVVTALHQKDLKLSRRTGLTNLAAPGLAANNGIRLRAYLDDPAFGTTQFFDQFLIPNLPVTPTFKPGFYESATITGPFVDIRYARTQTASLSGDYLNGRVNTLLGVSWNSLKRKIPKESTFVTDARGNFIHPGMPEDNPGAYEYDPRFDLSAQSKMAGITIEAWRAELARVYVIGSNSESFNWQSRQVFFGPDIGPVRGKTKEVGLRFELFRRKLTYTVSAYDTKRVNAAYAWQPDVLNLTQLEDLINPNNVLPGDAKYIEVVNGLNNERRTVNSNEQSRGIEMTLQSQRWLGLQSRIGFSKNRVRAQADFSQFRAYLQAAEERTTAANAPGGDRTMAELPAVLNNARNVLGSNTLTDEVAGRRSVPYTGSFVVDYQVPRVRGLRFGLNGIFTPDYNVYIFEGTPYRAGASFPLNGYLIYERRILQKYQSSFRLGVNNIYDIMNGDSRYRITSATSFNTTFRRPNFVYRYAEPTTWSFSVTTRL
ncbi:TonB-dependent receptor plug domain-containing protein [Horticoccus sp. 23ND18S-11]|uniref:TonB-dependent receptor plug domain-containing protein n=1 Tax=Horticoccus sp. 23ND18S-11 TaxID=3391832 RepID=UPI0039C96043